MNNNSNKGGKGTIENSYNDANDRSNTNRTPLLEHYQNY